jgi:hypothetical protein
MLWEEKGHHMAIEKDLLDQLLAGRDPLCYPLNGCPMQL